LARGRQDRSAAAFRRPPERNRAGAVPLSDGDWLALKRLIRPISGLKTAYASIKVLRGHAHDPAPPLHPDRTRGYRRSAIRQTNSSNSPPNPRCDRRVQPLDARQCNSADPTLSPRTQLDLTESDRGGVSEKVHLRDKRAPERTVWRSAAVHHWPRRNIVGDGPGFAADAQEGMEVFFERSVD
jgi:hypothetical protein